MLAVDPSDVSARVGVTVAVVATFSEALDDKLVVADVYKKERIYKKIADVLLTLNDKGVAVPIERMAPVAVASPVSVRVDELYDAAALGDTEMLPDGTCIVMSMLAAATVVPSYEKFDSTVMYAD